MPRVGSHGLAGVAVLILAVMCVVVVVARVWVG